MAERGLELKEKKKYIYRQQFFRKHQDKLHDKHPSSPTEVMMPDTHWACSLGRRRALGAGLWLGNAFGSREDGTCRSTPGSSADSALPRLNALPRVFRLASCRQRRERSAAEPSPRCAPAAPRAARHRAARTHSSALPLLWEESLAVSLVESMQSETACRYFHGLKTEIVRFHSH